MNTILVKTIKAENQRPFSLGEGVPFHPTEEKQGYVRGCIEFKGKHITGVLEGNALLSYEFEECGGCGAYHQITFTGDCRQDDSRFPTWEWSEMFDD